MINSIASVKKPPPSQESVALHAAWKASGKTQATIAEHMSVSPGFVSQWINGTRPVPAEVARKLGRYLDVAPQKISAQYGRVADGEPDGPSNVVPIRADDGSDKRRPDLAMNRVENDVQAMRYAMAGLVSVMIVHRPAEATDAATAIRRAVPKKYLERGFVYELLQVLEKAGKA